MVKQLAIYTFSIMGAFASAETSLRIPVFITYGRGSAPVQKLNKELKKLGETTIPEYIEVSNAKDADKQISLIEKRIAKATARVGGAYKDQEFIHDLYPAATHYKEFFTCYIGKGMEVAKLAQSLTDVLYSEQMGTWAWKYRKHTEIVDESLKDEGGEEFLSQNAPKIWHNWRGGDDSVLILTHVGDGGDDVAVSFIPQCEN